LDTLQGCFETYGLGDFEAAFLKISKLLQKLQKKDQNWRTSRGFYRPSCKARFTGCKANFWLGNPFYSLQK
jgi:hypothetical protein